MKREKNINCLVAALLAFCMAFGGVGCMVTGLKLEVSSLWALAFGCAAAAAVSALCCRFPHGGWILAVLGMFLILSPERRALLGDQTLTMLHRMTKLWSNAYGWPTVPMGTEAVADLPLMLIGALVAAVTARTICRRKRAFWATAAALLPLGSCLVVTDTVPDTAYLFVLLLGIAVLLLSNSVRRFDLGQGLELTAMAALAAALGLMLLFGLAPRENYVNNTEEIQDKIVAWAQDLPARVKEWGQKKAPGTVDAVQTQRENLSTLGKRIERDTPVLQVTADSEGLLYLRGQDFDSYDGKTWTATRNRMEDIPLPDLPGGSGLEQVRVDALRRRNVLYVPYYASLDTSIVGGRCSNEEDMQVYIFNRLPMPENWREYVKATEHYEEGIFATAGLYDSAKDQWRYRNLPLKTKARAESLLAAILTGAEATATDKADAIAAYVRNSALYSLDPGTMPAGEEDFALWFLEQQTEGYCVHFATATVVLLRAAGIDARYVTGYVANAQAGQMVTVRAKQSHAWAEYFEPLLGTWVVLESTPADLTQTQPETRPETTAPSEPGQTAAPTLPEKPEPPATDPVDDGIRFADDRGSGMLKKLAAGLKWILTPVLAVGLVLGQYRLRRKVRRKRQTTGNPNRRALALWEETVLLHRLLKASPPDDLEGLAQKAKFSQHTLTREELLSFTDVNQESVQRLQECPYLQRLLHRYLFAAY